MKSKLRFCLVDIRDRVVREKSLSFPERPGASIAVLTFLAALRRLSKLMAFALRTIYSSLPDLNRDAHSNYTAILGLHTDDINNLLHPYCGIP
ncbi:hypothetical protein SISSUDRAFT_715016 [Sistotremastrum suecicum HHB10207 ss-3]|uniref:Uncharacterized protein n=1 Tax=Sistotremastrum suecicum HHB10207 ss-3 TaxID=1314776 RepID=A0A166DPP9_9AGAM|nr:hypothetical protein SISSUDRAFT_715016 [Sistotremastrum suecicum HHB10207 ss-3]